MRIYRLRLDSNIYQGFLPEDEEIWKTPFLKMDCTRKLPNWAPPDIYVPNPTLKRGNFFHLCAGAFVSDSEATEKLRDQLEMAGELLPLQYKGEPYTLVNVTECMDCLDHERTEWVTDAKTKIKVRIRRHIFKPNRIPESTVFKIPERLATIFTVVGRFDPQDEFKYLVEKYKLKGLLFEEVWSDES